MRRLSEQLQLRAKYTKMVYLWFTAFHILPMTSYLIVLFKLFLQPHSQCQNMRCATPGQTNAFRGLECPGSLLQEAQPQGGCEGKPKGHESALKLGQSNVGRGRFLGPARAPLSSSAMGANGHAMQVE